MAFANKPKPRKVKAKPAPFLPDGHAPNLKGNKRIEAMHYEIVRLRKRLEKLEPVVAFIAYLGDMMDEKVEEGLSDHEVSEH